MLAFDLFRTTAETEFFLEPFQRGGQFSAIIATWIKGLAVCACFSRSYFPLEPGALQYYYSGRKREDRSFLQRAERLSD